MTPSTPSSTVSDRDALPALADIVSAARRLRGRGVVTPLLHAPALDRRIGGRLLVKAEMLQRTGSFKFRGAYNRISRLDAGARARGVVAYSSGNHAQAVAAVAGLLGIGATIVMPADAPAIKIEGTRAHGAEIVFYDRDSDVREEVAARICEATGAVMIRPYDDARIIAGQGTVGLEIAEQAGAMDATIDAALVPCGGGGLVSGTATALAALSPATEVYAVEPAGFDDTRRSLASGRRETVDPVARSFCDALLVPTPGALTFAINAKLLAGGLAVDDGAVADAMAAAFRHLKVVVEPGGAVALAAALTGAFDCRGRTVVVVCSGGNVDAETYRAAIGGGTQAP